MKKSLLFAILALSFNAVAQIKRPTSVMSHPSILTTESITSSSTYEGRNISGRLSENHPRQTLINKALEQRSLILLFDSIYTWKLDTLTMGWQKKDKTIDIVYDANNNWINWASALYQLWNGSEWVNHSLETGTCDVNNNRTYELYQDWNGNAWVNTAQRTWTYDANNNQTSDIYQEWDGSAWINAEQSNYTYDADNNLISYLSQYWNNGILDGYWQETYTYDANNNRTYELDQTWNGSIFVNDRQYIWTYDVNNNQISELYQYWASAAWVNTQKLTYTYDANNNRTSFLRENWNSSSWVNYEKNTYTYDARNNQISDLYQHWDASAWVNSGNKTYTYDANNNRTNALYQHWDGSTWVNNWLDVIIYDANNFAKSLSTKYWNTAGTEIDQGDSTCFYFHTALGINDLIAKENVISIYPNPSSGKFTISSNSAMRSAEVYDFTGACVYADVKFNKQFSKEIDLSNSPSGIYFIKINSGNKVSWRKVIIL